LHNILLVLFKLPSLSLLCRDIVKFLKFIAGTLGRRWGVSSVTWLVCSQWQALDSVTNVVKDKVFVS
jgi:hypothetical protein